MFKQQILKLQFCSLLLASISVHGADEGGSSSSAVKPEFVGVPSAHRNDDFDPMGLQARMAARFKKILDGEQDVSDEAFARLLLKFDTDLPSKAEAENRVAQLAKEHPKLDTIIQYFAEPDEYKDIKYPSRMLFLGPCGCGKTTAALAIAKHCNMHCAFVRASAVGNTYQNSGATLIEDLFAGMLGRENQSFMLLCDEFLEVAKFSDEDRDEQRIKTAIALWTGLDACRRRRNVCVVGTDYRDIEQLQDPFKTRFMKRIFHFKPVDDLRMFQIIKECLLSSEGTFSSECSDAFLQQMAKDVLHLSIREVEDLVEDVKMEVRVHSKGQHAVITEEHLKEAFREHKKPGWIESVWNKREKHFSNLTSARAASIYMLVGGLGLSSQDYKYGAMLMGLGGFVNAYWAEGKDLQLFGLVHHMFAQYESRRQWETSHQFNVQNSEEAKAARARDEKRANEQLELSREANERAKSDQIFKIKEALKRIAMDHEVDRSHDQYSLRTGTKKELSEHYAYLQEELKKLELEEEKKNETEAKGEDACTLS